MNVGGKANIVNTKCLFDCLLTTRNNTQRLDITHHLHSLFNLSAIKRLLWLWASRIEIQSVF